MTDLPAAWRRTLDAVADLGDKIAAEPWAAADPAAQAEAFEHLADQLVVWTAWETLHADPTRPFFHRHNDLTSQWGGPNNDNVYRHARIDPDHRYVVRGRMHSCQQFLLAIRAGFMHNPVWGTLATVTASDLGIAEGDEFELHFGGDHPDAIELPDGAIMISVREYYFDWQADEPATFTIECCDPDPSPPVTAEDLDTRWANSAAQIDQSMTYWQHYMAENRAQRSDNSFADNAETTVGKGLPTARYDFCFWELGPDDALLIEADVPQADYWSVHLYTMENFEPVDPYAAISSRNHRQSEVSPDGRLRIVVAGTDPGAANWLDTMGRRNGLCTIRWFWPHNEARPDPGTTVVPVDEVWNHLPTDTPRRGSSDRADELAARQAHLRWRFRT